MQLLMPSAGFDDPLELLGACHRRVAGFCDTLERLVAHLKTAGPDDDARHAAKRILSYFDQAAPHHHADEEVDLLPLLRLRAEESDASTIENWAERISAEHREQNALWTVLREELQQLIDGKGSSLNAAAAFIGMEREHYQFEDRVVFHLAGKLLHEGDLETLGRAMASRRNRPYPEED